MFKISSLGVEPFRCLFRCTLGTDSPRSRGAQCEGDNSLSLGAETQTQLYIHPHIVHRNDFYIH